MGIQHNGVTLGYFQVKYVSPILGSYLNAIICVDILTGSLVGTKDGRVTFDLFRDGGTLSTMPTRSRFKVQYYNETDSKINEQWHGNGVEHFVAKNGQAYLA